MLLTLVSLLSAQPAQPPHRFVFLGADRFAHYADLASLQPEGSGGRIRVFQVVAPDSVPYSLLTLPTNRMV